LDDRVTVEPAAQGDYTAATKQNSNDDADNQTRIALFGLFFGGNRHFRHDFFSF
jgi:hypothetical protein